MMFDAEVLAAPDGIELCFEELRAEHMRRIAVPPDAATGSGGCDAPTAAPVPEAAPAPPQPTASLVSTPRQNDPVVLQSPDATGAVAANSSAQQAASEGARTAVRELAAGATGGEEAQPPASVQPSTTVPPALEPSPTAVATPGAAFASQNLPASPALMLTAVRGDSGRWDAENLAPARLTPAPGTEVAQCEGSTPIKAPSAGKSSVKPRTGLRPRTPIAPTGPAMLAQQSPLPAPRLSGSPQLRGEAASAARSLPASPARAAGDDTTSFDLFGGAFSGALSEPGVSGLEPTVTINTLEAYSAMNDMFNGTLPHETARPGAPLPLFHSHFVTRPTCSNCLVCPWCPSVLQTGVSAMATTLCHIIDISRREPDLNFSDGRLCFAGVTIAISSSQGCACSLPAVQNALLRAVSRPAIPLPPRRPSLGGNKRRSGLFAPRNSGRTSVRLHMHPYPVS